MEQKVVNIQQNQGKSDSLISQLGQGVVEYAIILLFVSIGAGLIIRVLGPAFSGTFSELANEAPVAPPSIMGYNPPPTVVITSSVTPPSPTPPPIWTPTVTPFPTSTPPPPPTFVPTPTSAPASNLCGQPGVSVTQSSTANGGYANLACDGNTDGDFANGSVTETNGEANAYWEIDLGSLQQILQLKIFNRTDCCSSWLSNFKVFVSEVPFQSTDPVATSNQAGVTTFTLNGGGDFTAFAVNQDARYIRIQLTGSNPLSLAEVEVIGTNWSPPACEGIVDMLYIFDLSGSMGQDYAGSGTKLDASKNAVTSVNNDIAAQNNGSRVGLVTFTSTGWYTTTAGYFYPQDINEVNLSTNIAGINSQVNGWASGGGTPTGGALDAARLMLLAQWDPHHIPIVVLVSDGVPTINQSDIPFNDYNVQSVPIYSGGVPRDPSAVAVDGNIASFSHGLPAGNVLAEAMVEIQEFKNAFPTTAIHSVAIQSASGGIFNSELLEYVAEVGGGDFYTANNPDELTNALSSIYDSVTCEPPDS